MLMAVKYLKLLTMVVCTVFFAMGCDKKQTASPEIDKVQTETKQTSQGMKNYAFSEKAEFFKTMQDQFKAQRQNLDELSAKIDRFGHATKAEAKPKLQALRDQAAQFKQQLADARNATDSTWDDVQAGSKIAYTTLDNDVTKARQWASDNIEP